MKGERSSRFQRPKGETNNNPTAADSSSSSAPPPPWIDLPRDVTANILRRLGPEEILFSAESVCSTWRSVCADPSLWRVFDMKYSDIRNRILLSGKVCRRAVDRSQGQMIDITIRHFGTNGLLRYISQRSCNSILKIQYTSLTTLLSLENRCSTHLKKLTLESCNAIKPLGFEEALKNLSHLEELHLFYMPLLSDLDIETIAISCPMLNSFTFNNYAYDFKIADMDNSLALSIAKNMPNLRRLRLVCDWMDNEGLLAILDGCLNLELLDLLHCFGVDMECDDLGRRCSEQVKMLRGPLDSSADCEWDSRVYDFRDCGREDEVDDYDYSDNNSVGCRSCFEGKWFYNPYNDPADFLLEGIRSKKSVDVEKEGTFESEGSFSGVETLIWDLFAAMERKNDERWALVEGNILEEVGKVNAVVERVEKKVDEEIFRHGKMEKEFLDLDYGIRRLKDQHIEESKTERDPPPMDT